MTHQDMIEQREYLEQAHYEMLQEYGEEDCRTVNAAYELDAWIRMMSFEEESF